MSQNKNTQKTMPLSTAIVAIALAFFVGLFVERALFSTGGGQSTEITKQVLGSGGGNQAMNVNNQMLQHIKDEEAKLQVNPDDANGWAHLGNLYFDTDQYAKAVDAYSKSLAISPNNTNVMTDMGTMHRALGNFDEAIKVYDQVLALDPNHRNARLNRGVVLIYDLGRKEEGINTWKILIQKYPDIKAADGRPLSDFIKDLEKSN